jgi:hypothetical protein
VVIIEIIQQSYRTAVAIGHSPSPHSLKCCSRMEVLSSFSVVSESDLTAL